MAEGLNRIAMPVKYGVCVMLRHILPEPHPQSPILSPICQAAVFSTKGHSARCQVFSRGAVMSLANSSETCAEKLDGGIECSKADLIGWTWLESDGRGVAIKKPLK